MGDLSINQIVISWLNSVYGMNSTKIEYLLKYFNESLQDLWDNFNKEKSNLSMLSQDVINKLTDSKDNFENNLIDILHKENAQVVTYFDDDYPKKLRNIDGFPYILYYKGNLSCADNLSIAVVGSRKATAYGKWACEKFTKELAELKVTIVSGLAAGIDSIAHKTAIKNKSNTIGVIGCGIDVVYPKNNEELYNELIKNDGLIVTEFPFGTKPLHYNFPIRNRIISGLSDGVLVIEAQQKSGTLITASHAANQGKDIFALPGNIDSLYSKGTNLLIKDGAKIVTCIDDIIEEINDLKSLVSKKETIIDYSTLSDDEIKIINCIRTGSKSLYIIKEEANLEIGTTLTILTFLEMKGFIKQLPGKIFSLL